LIELLEVWRHSSHYAFVQPIFQSSIFIKIRFNKWIIGKIWWISNGFICRNYWTYSFLIDCICEIHKNKNLLRFRFEVLDEESNFFLFWKESFLVVSFNNLFFFFYVIVFLFKITILKRGINFQLLDFVLFNSDVSTLSTFP
jgi:hypothetical protein